jgi:outer membrane lipopolysaccharide assembly protein LptE/RlpB
MSLSKITAVMVLLASTGLVACGFRMQGIGPFPESLATTYIDTPDRYTVFYRELRSELEQGGVKIVDSPVHSNAIIRVEADNSGQNVLTVSGRNVPTEYNVFYNISYSVWVDSEEVLPVQDLSLTQAYTYDPTIVLGKNRERDAIRDALAENLVRQVAQQLSLLK